ncbi:MAG: hypothetical protein LBO77_00345, partial [Desulfovibrio sp.]|nr:hypothetical protein [Desulfovibrio sp.]
ASSPFGNLARAYPANKIFHDAIQCAKEKYLTAGTCAKPDNKRKICAFCREHGMFEDVAKSQKAKAEGKIPTVAKFS